MTETVAPAPDNTIALSSAGPSLRELMEDGIYLGRCGVLSAYRGYGIQRQMIRLRVQWARRHGYRWAVSDTTDNIPSANNLISCGFRLYTPKITYSFARALYWRKKL
jgi:GNAT superfamily N-acetyltransferase